MPRKSIKIIHENTEEVDSIEKDYVPEPKVVKEKKPRSEKQIAAFAKALETRKAKKAEKALAENMPKEIVVPEVEVPEVEVPEVEMTNVKKRGRPSMSAEKIEEKATMKELALQNQLNKLQQKLDKAAKREAKKEMLNKIKSKMNTDDDNEDIDTDDEIEIDKIVNKQKKPIVIVNKIDNGKIRKQPIMAQPTAIFV
jgi:hypothetical protein